MSSENAPVTRRHIVHRVGFLLILLLATAVLSLMGGKMYGHWKAEAARQEHWESTRLVMEKDRAYFNADSLFPGFPLFCQDSTLTTVHEQLADGGLLVFVSPDCPNCENALAVLDRSLRQCDRHRRVIIVAPQDDMYAYEWIDSLGIDIPLFLDETGFIETGYDFVVIPFMVLLDEHHRVVTNSTGAWTESDYTRMLRL